MAEKTSIWSLNFVLVMFGKAFSSAVFAMLTASLATYMFATYETSVSMTGIGIGAFIVAALISRIFAGRYIEVVGRKRMLIAGSVAFVLFSLCYFIPVGFVGFVVIRFLHGLAFGVANNTFNVVVTAFIPHDKWGQGMGFFSLSNTLSSAVGPFVGVFLVQQGMFRELFAVGVLFSVISLVLGCLLKIKPVNYEAEKDDQQRNNKAAFIAVEAIPISIIVAFSCLCYSSVTSYMNTYTTEGGFGEAAMWFFLVYSVMLVVSRPSMGRLFDAKGENFVVYPSCIIMCVAFVLLSLCKSTALLIVIAILFAFGFGTLQSSLQTLVVKNTAPGRMGTATATFYAFADAGHGVGPAIMGSVASGIGYAHMYVVGAAVALVLAFVYFFSHGRKARRGEID